MRRRPALPQAEGQNVKLDTIVALADERRAAGRKRIADSAAAKYQNPAVPRRGFTREIISIL